MVKRIYEKLSTLANLPTLRIHKVKHKNKICIRGKIFVKNNSSKEAAIILGDSVVINSSVRANPVSGSTTKLYAMKNGEIIIGSRVGLSNCTIISNHKIVIGDDVLIGAGTIITDTDFHSTDYKERKEDKLIEDDKCDVTIENDVFIGANCIVLKGVSIGRFSVIGAGSVVTKSIPEGEIWAGNPARYIKRVN